MLHYKKTVCLISLFLSGHSFGKTEETNYIVRFKNVESISQFKNTRNTAFTIERPLVENLSLYLIKSQDSNLIQSLERNSNILYIQKDHPITKRSITPDDPDISKVWSIMNSRTAGADTHVTKAWEKGTGGKDALGNDIVLAVVDGGVDVAHPDLIENIWVNENEIPGNGIDDDGNGYIDDVNGWNAFRKNGAVPADYHGTHVSGILGAKGNNQSHASGLNWNVKIMGVAGSSGTTSVILEAYGYVLAQKKLWIDSKGKKGANVVATNSSFGIDRANCNSGDYPVWNDIYTEMGKVGILSAAATANRAYDVDVVGDVPTQCSSPYVVAVTNTTIDDKINYGAAWGKQSVDLGAPGTDIWSTIPGNKSKTLTGTSMATPQVTGAIGLLHSLASTELSTYFHANPAEGALLFKKALLESVDANSDLAGRTVSEGRINLDKASQAVSSMKLNKL